MMGKVTRDPETRYDYITIKSQVVDETKPAIERFAAVLKDVRTRARHRPPSDHYNIVLIKHRYRRANLWRLIKAKKPNE